MSLEPSCGCWWDLAPRCVGISNATPLLAPRSVLTSRWTKKPAGSLARNLQLQYPWTFFIFFWLVSPPLSLSIIYLYVYVYMYMCEYPRFKPLSVDPKYWGSYYKSTHRKDPQFTETATDVPIRPTFRLMNTCFLVVSRCSEPRMLLAHASGLEPWAPWWLWYLGSNTSVFGRTSSFCQGDLGDP